ncbi:MAG: ADYC domain-containing protein [Rhodopila sp.]
MDGSSLRSADLVGAVLEANDEEGRLVTVRIEAVRPDPSDAEGDIWLHEFSVLDPRAGAWTPLCVQAPDGTTGGFPLSGRWTPDGRHLADSHKFTLTCTSGAVGKCVRFGYKPWRSRNEESLWGYHQACVRMMRADYGGDGTPHTRDGTKIDVFDRFGIQKPESSPDEMTFEAAWDQDGAVCVRRTRIPALLNWQALVAVYPYLAHTPENECSEATPAMLWNRS